MDPGVKMTKEKKKFTETDSVKVTYKIPTQADFLVAYSSAEGT